MKLMQLENTGMCIYSQLAIDIIQITDTHPVHMQVIRNKSSDQYRKFLYITNYNFIPTYIVNITVCTMT